jgi:hypothetical protein
MATSCPSIPAAAKDPSRALLVKVHREVSSDFTSPGTEITQGPRRRTTTEGAARLSVFIRGHFHSLGWLRRKQSQTFVSQKRRPKYRGLGHGYARCQAVCRRLPLGDLGSDNLRLVMPTRSSLLIPGRKVSAYEPLACSRRQAPRWFVARPARRWYDIRAARQRPTPQGSSKSSGLFSSQCTNSRAA